MSSYRTFIDSFSSLDDLKKKDWHDYEKVKAAVIKAGRFSVFEATETDLTARQMTRICQDPDLEIDNATPYPWTEVRLRKFPT